MVLDGSSWKVSVRLVIGRSSVRIRPRAPKPQVRRHQATRAGSGGIGGGNLSSCTDVDTLTRLVAWGSGRRCRVVSFARLIHRRVRALNVGRPSACAAFGGHLSLPWLPHGLVRHRQGPSATCILHACPSPEDPSCVATGLATGPAWVASARPLDEDLPLARCVGGLDGLFRLTTSELPGHDRFQRVRSGLRETHHAFVLAELIDPKLIDPKGWRSPDRWAQPG
jgi:hypothetical protein